MSLRTRLSQGVMDGLAKAVAKAPPSQPKAPSFEAMWLAMFGDTQEQARKALQAQLSSPGWKGDRWVAPKALTGLQGGVLDLQGVASLNRRLDGWVEGLLPGRVRQEGLFRSATPQELEPVHAVVDLRLHGKLLQDPAWLQARDRVTSAWGHGYLEPLRAAWEQLAAQGRPTGPLQADLALLRETRALRWRALTGGEPPRALRLHRGVTGEGRVREVARLWAQPGASHLPLRHHSLSSWSVDPKVALAFGQVSRGGSRGTVVMSLEVPFEQTLLDKWADGGHLLSKYGPQQEVVVATPRPNQLRVPKEDLVVFWEGRRYGYEDRAALLDALGPQG